MSEPGEAIPIVLKRRTLPEMMTHAADRLRRGEDPQMVALLLDLMGSTAESATPAGSEPAEVREDVPDWCVAPAVLLRIWLDERGRRVVPPAVGEVLRRQPLTEMHANMLELVTGIPAQLWLTLERTFRAGLAAGLTEATG
jgi:hypothetical protein